MTAVPTIRVRGLTVYTHHGVGEAERETGQRMIFDLDLVPLSAGRSPPTTSPTRSITARWRRWWPRSPPAGAAAPWNGW